MLGRVELRRTSGVKVCGKMKCVESSAKATTVGSSACLLWQDFYVGCPS